MSGVFLNIMSNKPLVSVIIPTKNSGGTIGECIKSVKNQTYKNLEIIVVDNNSSDKTQQIVEDLRLKIKDLRLSLYTKGPERSAQRNFGASKAKGDYLLFVDSDMELSKTVIEYCIRQVESYKVNKVLGGIIIPEKSFGIGFWAKCKALERSFYVGVDWIEAARFFKRSVFVEFKGYDENQTGTEDYDLPQRIKEKYGENTISRINAFIMHNEGKLSLTYTLKKKFYYAKTANEYVKTNSKYFSKQANPVNRYILYFSKPEQLFKNPVVGFGMLFMKTFEFAAGGFGYILGL